MDGPNGQRPKCEVNVSLHSKGSPWPGILFLVFAWLAGTGALTLGLLREGTDYVAISGFLVACVLWYVAYAMLRARGLVVRMLTFALIIFWILSLIFAAAVGRSAVYTRVFFVPSLTAALLLLIFASVRSARVAKPPSSSQQRE
jgi:hypothetical protein